MRMKEHYNKSISLYHLASSQGVEKDQCKKNPKPYPVEHQIDRFKLSKIAIVNHTLRYFLRKNNGYLW